MQVYYLPFIVFYNQCVFPTVFATLPIIRTILIREGITIIHGHSVSSLGVETLHSGVYSQCSNFGEKSRRFQDLYIVAQNLYWTGILFTSPDSKCKETRIKIEDTILSS